MDFRCRLFFTAVAASVLLIHFSPVQAQENQAPGMTAQPQQNRGGFVFTPYVLFSTRYDDNIFASVSQPESDTILSLTPGFAMTYMSARTHFNFDYSLTAEKYARHSELSSWAEAQGGSIGIDHAFTPRFKAGVQGGYQATHNPGQLTPEAGVVVGRGRATRASIQPELSYEFSQRTSLNAFYQRARTELEGGRRTDIGTASVAVNHQLSPRDELQFQYQNIYHDFDTDGSVSSNLLTVGWDHAISRNTSFLLSAGPRDTETRVVPEVLARIRYQSKNTAYTLAYYRTQRSIIGQTDVVDVQGLSGSFTFAPTSRWSITVAPGYFHNDGPGASVNTFHAGLYIWYRFTRHLSLGLTEDYRLQHGLLGRTDNPTLRRNMVGITLRWGLPIRGGDFRRGELPEARQGLLQRDQPQPGSPGSTRMQ